MDLEQLRQDVADGTIQLDRLIDVIGSLQKLIQSQQKLIEQLQGDIERLKELNQKNPTQRLDESYSEKAEEQRQAEASGKRKKHKPPKRSGRFKTAAKILRVDRTEHVYPDGFNRDDCRWCHTRAARRLEHGRADLVAYEIYLRGRKHGRAPGLVGLGEFGTEILIAPAHPVYTLGLSLDKACQVLGFFQGRSISKSQAHALLNQLAQAWESEFDTLRMLLANSAVVHCDETGWSINSAWAFLTDRLTVMFYGVHKDGATLEQILDKATFSGVLISDDAAIYQGFNKSQKCWADQPSVGARFAKPSS